MARLNLLTATTWLYSKIDTDEVPSKVQLVMFHLIKMFNANHWSPLQTISVNKIHANANIGERTVKSALDDIIQRGWLVNTANGYVLATNSIPKTNITKNVYKENDENERTEISGGGLEGRNLPESVLAILNRQIS